MLIKRLAVFLCPVLIFVCLRALSGYDQIQPIAMASIVASLLLLFFLKYFIKEKFFSPNYFYLIIPPFLLLFTTIFFLLILGSDNIKNVVMVISSLIIYLYCESIFLFYYWPTKYYPSSLENLSSFIGLTTFFLLAINLNAINIFINLPLWLSSLILIVFLSLLLIQNFWINKIDHKLMVAYIFIINIVILEFFWALSFLPANFLVNGMILTILFYFVTGTLKAQINAKLDKKIFRRYVVISAVLLLLVILTNSWT